LRNRNFINNFTELHLIKCELSYQLIVAGFPNEPVAAFTGRVRFRYGFIETAAGNLPVRVTRKIRLKRNACMLAKRKYGQQKYKIAQTQSNRKIKKKIRIGKVCMIQQKQGWFPCTQKTGHRNPDRAHRFRTYGGYRR
jgi:hypothetical protein